MRANDQVKKCVVFLATDLHNTDDTVTKRLRATAFFVVRRYGPNEFLFLVTARHVVEKVISLGCEKMYCRLNRNDGGADFIDIDPHDWRFHPVDANADVAVLRCTISQQDYDFLPLSTEIYLSDQIIADENIGVGDDVLLVGLFSEHSGAKRNIPLVRVGTLAAMPEEPVLSDGKLMDAYLVEARSMGGLSGSPVFVHLVANHATNTLVTKARTGKDMYFLGVMHGHWERDASVGDDLDDDDGSREQLNMGIAIVTPASQVLEALDASFLKP